MQKIHKKILFKKLLSVSLICFVLIIQLIPFGIVNAASLSPRSLTLSAGSNGDAGAKVGGIVNHNYNFKMTTPDATIGSVKIVYCTTAAAVPSGLDCNTPAGLSTQNVTPATAITNQAGATGFTISAGSPNGTIILTRTAAAVTGVPTISFTMNNITNPTTNPITSSGTFFARISIYSSEDATTGLNDSGTVAASTVTQIELSGIMPESLVFCVGKTITTTDDVPDCRTVTTGTVTFNQLFSPSDTAFATSQMAASTNAASGYVITVNGPTLTSGSNTIAEMSVLGIPIHGVAQFGLNLVKNTGINPIGPVTYASAGGFGLNIGEGIVNGTTNGTNRKAEATVGVYDQAEKFKFTTGDPVAASTNGGAGPTDAQIFTVSYIANVTGSQPAGLYSTTLTYICTPTF
jgi:hypothetical protein